MLHGVTPGPLAWSFVGSVVLVVVLVVLSSSAYACCAKERGPITNCSFSHNQDTFLCNVADLGYHVGTCPDRGFTDLNNIPAHIKKDSFSIKPYFTSCSPTDGYRYDVGLDASSCHTPCHHDNEAVHAGLNITFRAQKWTAEDLRAITISLRYNTQVYVHCVMLQFGERSLTNKAAEEHEFYYDGFIGLLPGGTYTVSVLTLPTNIDRSNYVSKTIQIPMETCWVPDVKFHDTPFAVNLTLFQDLLYNFTQFDVHLYHNPDHPITKRVDFNTAELFEIDGKWGTNIVFDCIEPTAEKLKIYIASHECPFCDWNMTEILVKAVPPSFSNCPEQDIIHEVEMRRIMNNTTSGVNWSPPNPIFQSKCVYGRNSTHNPNATPFQVGRTTPVIYSAWQYASLAQCTFNVQVRTVDTISPRITDCPDNINAHGNPRTKSLEVTWRTPTYDDVSDTTMTIVSPDIPNLQNRYNFPVGANTTVTYRIADAYNNIAYCNFSVYIEEKPSATPLVIGVSCSAGLLLILLVAVLFWCSRISRVRQSQGNCAESPENIYGFTNVNPDEPAQGVPFRFLEKYASQSQVSISGIVKTPSSHLTCPERSRSVPDIKEHSSGYMSNNEDEFFPIFGHPRLQPPSQLDSVIEEENRPLVWKRVDSNDGGMSSSGSQSSSSYDDSPVSLESTC